MSTERFAKFKFSQSLFELLYSVNDQQMLFYFFNILRVAFSDDS